jgi:hypothetical protein
MMTVLDKGGRGRKMVQIRPPESWKKAVAPVGQVTGRLEREVSRGYPGRLSQTWPWGPLGIPNLNRFQRPVASPDKGVPFGITVGGNAYFLVGEAPYL